MPLTRHPSDDGLEVLQVGALVAVCSSDGASRPGLVVASEADSLRLHLAGRLVAVRDEPVVVAWGVDGGVRELRVRVLDTDPRSNEVRVTREGTPSEERRAVTRFAVMAEALLVVDGEELTGLVSDLSVLGAGLILPTAPDGGAVGELVLHDAGELLLPGAPVRVVGVAADARGRWRVSVEFSDPVRVADATSRLITALDHS